MILDLTQIVLLLICTGLLAFVCHRLVSHKAQPTNLVKSEDAPEDLPEPDIKEIRETLTAYIERESRVLELIPPGDNPQYIDYSCGYPGRFEMRLTIWIGRDLDIVATRLMIGREYHNTFKRLKENNDKVNWLFPEGEVDYKLFSSDFKGVGVEKRLDLTQRENWHEISVWVRENLEKLLYVIRVHDAIQESDN